MQATAAGFPLNMSELYENWVVKLRTGNCGLSLLLFSVLVFRGLIAVVIVVVVVVVAVVVLVVLVVVVVVVVVE
jgi:hypothetical protein